MEHKHGFNSKNALVVVIAVFLAIVVARAESHGDAWITTKAKANLEVAAGVRASAVTVDTEGGRVTLSGTVRSEKERRIAADKVRNVAGVLEVRNLLQVAAPSSKRRVWPSDDAVKRPGVRTVSSETGVLDAMTTPSVERNVGIPRRVVSPLQRDPVTSEDDAIRRDVEDALYALDARANADIHVQVKNGVVRLSGNVPTWQGNDSRVSAARSVTGVRSIINSLHPLARNVDAR